MNLVDASIFKLGQEGGGGREIECERERERLRETQRDSERLRESDREMLTSKANSFDL